MTLEQARAIIHSCSTNWPFSRLTSEQLKELEQAYKVVREYEIQQLGEGRF